MNRPAPQRRRALIESTLYFSVAIAILELVSRTHDHHQPYSVERMHIKMAPLVGGLTLWLQRRASPSHTTSAFHPDWHALGKGSLAGISSFGAWLLVAHQRHWIRVPAWGWETASTRDILTSLTIFSLGNAAIAWNEETLFRGAGYDQWSAAIGPLPASALVTGLFALAHGPQPLVILGEASLGVMLLALRHTSGSVWLPMGYHWASNVVQSAVFGIPEAEPSLLPLVVDGPSLWTGRPGKAEPGWLFIVLNLLIATGIACRWWLQRRKHM